MSHTLVETSDETMLAINEAQVEYPRSTLGNTRALYNAMVNAGDIASRSVGMGSTAAHALLSEVQQGGIFNESLNKLTR